MDTYAMIARHVPSDPPIDCFRILAQKFASRTFDTEFLACLLTVSAWLVGRGVAPSPDHPVFGDLSEDSMAEVHGLCCEILEDANQEIPAGGVIQALAIRAAIKLLWQFAQSEDFRKIIDSLLSGGE